MSVDGANWTFLGGNYIGLQGTLQAGVFVSSHDRRTLNKAAFSGVRVLPGHFSANDVGANAIPGTVSWFGGLSNRFSSAPLGSILVTASGTDIWGANDEFQFVHQQVSGRIEQAWIVDTLTAHHPSAKAGVMLRQGPRPDTLTVILDMKPNGEAEFMARSCPGCDMTYLGGTWVGFPATLRLSREGDRVLGSVRRKDGTWAHLGSITFMSPDALWVGLAVTSHDPNSIATAVFRSYDPPLEASSDR